MGRKQKLSHFLFLLFVSISTIRLLGLNLVNTDYLDPVYKSHKPRNDSNIILPQKIIVHGTNIDLPIITTPYKENVWSLSIDGATLVNQKQNLSDPLNNSILFAHSTNAFFKQLHNVKEGGTVSITESKKMYMYEIKKVFETKPAYVGNVNSVGDTNLTLFTCTGENDKSRLVVKAKRKFVFKYIYGGVI